MHGYYLIMGHLANRPPLSDIHPITRHVVEETNFLDVLFYARVFALMTSKGQQQV